MKPKRLLPAAMLMLCMAGGAACAQDQVEELLRDFRNYRYADILLYELQGRAKARVAERLQAHRGDTSRSALERAAGAEGSRAAQQCAARYTSVPRMAGCLRSMGIDMTPAIQELLRYYAMRGRHIPAAIDDIYIITTRPRAGVAPLPIALLLVRNATGNLERDLRSVQAADIYTAEELQALGIGEGAPPGS